MSAKRRFRPNQATVVAPSRRPSPPGTRAPDPVSDQDRRGEGMPAPRGLRALARSALRARPRAVAVAAATTLAATLALGGGVAVSLAATSATCPQNPPGCAGVYFDSDHNVGAGPNPFNATFTGVQNVALGHTMMGSLTDGSYNVASGFGALSRNTSGYENTATGNSALFSNTTGSRNVANGPALFLNTTGNANVATGTAALYHNTSGTNNVASGDSALLNNTTGNNNLASGTNALFNNTTGSSNVALGFRAGNNVTFGSNNVHIANEGFAGESGKIHIGTKGKQNAAFIAGVSGSSIPGPTQTVVVNTNGRLGTATSSSERLKRDVRPLAGAASGRVLALRPVSYRYKRAHAAGNDRLQYGLIAEQVARQLPALVQRGPTGRPAGVYYEQLSTLLLAELKRQDRELRRLRALVLRRR